MGQDVVPGGFEKEPGGSLQRTTAASQDASLPPPLHRHPHHACTPKRQLYHSCITGGSLFTSTVKVQVMEHNPEVNNPDKASLRTCFGHLSRTARAQVAQGRGRGRRRTSDPLHQPNAEGLQAVQHPGLGTRGRRPEPNGKLLVAGQKRQPLANAPHQLPQGHQHPERSVAQ